MTRTPPPRYQERLRLVWWLWPFGLGLAVLLAAAVHSGYGGLRSWLPYVVATLLALFVLYRVDRTQVAVVDGRLEVARCRLPVEVVSAVRILDRDQLSVLARTGRHPDGFQVLRGWIGHAVQVRLDDPTDCTPYWLFSTRHPEAVADAIAAERARIVPGPVD